VRIFASRLAENVALSTLSLLSGTKRIEWFGQRDRVRWCDQLIAVVGITPPRGRGSEVDNTSVPGFADLHLPDLHGGEPARDH
jgi:hypothetical protein